MPTSLDLILAGSIAIAYPIWDYLWGWPRALRTIRSGRPDPRVSVYREIIGLLWLLSFLIAWRWLRADRPWSALGLVWPTGWRLGVTAALVLAVLALDAMRTRAIARMTPERLARVRSSDAPLVLFAPHTRAEYAWFHAVSVTAGICEELIYRGFLVWALRPWLTLWGAALASVVSFAFAHAYEGRRGAVSVGILGAIFGVLAILTGSILPGMVLHALVDHVSSRASYRILRGPDTGDAVA